MLIRPEGHSPLDLSTFETKSLLRFWSHGSTWRPWRYCWTFLPTRRCCAATSPLTSPCWLAPRPSSTNKSVLKTQTTRCSLLPLKWRWCLFAKWEDRGRSYQFKDRKVFFFQLQLSGRAYHHTPPIRLTDLCGGAYPRRHWETLLKYEKRRF